MQDRPVTIEIAELETDGFSDPEAGRIEEQEERDIGVRTQHAG